MIKGPLPFAKARRRVDGFLDICACAVHRVSDCVALRQIGGDARRQRTSCPMGVACLNPLGLPKRKVVLIEKEVDQTIALQMPALYQNSPARQARLALWRPHSYHQPTGSCAR